MDGDTKFARFPQGEIQNDGRLCPAPAFSPTPSVGSDEVMAGYMLGKIIGYGGFSTICRAYSTSGGAVPVKIVCHLDLHGQGKVPLARKHLEHEAEV
ncbi:hypothetical protein IW261DRAFT_1576260 [Armillaria novae-zelandiae]|uniref:Protein kinase domain-containing protein n=1 Tax=Armillaria novae-zelandiae TaxID=153914 RepID=A0AA39NBU9_9AGAR|nr:hypothetical protein IW261DRAFT_1576260 [Armillaria novae-zelandiae]